MTGPCPTTEIKKRRKGTLQRQVGEGAGGNRGATLSDSRESFMKVSLQTAATEGILSAGLKL